LTKPINLQEIVYPVFRLGAEKPVFLDGVVLYLRQYKDEDGQTVQKVRIIDDTNLPGETLALRRLEILKSKVKLKSLGNAVFFLGDLIKLAHRKLWFIDSAGNVFQYKKTAVAKLVFKKITLMHHIPSGGAIIEVEGIPSRFKCLYSPRAGEQYAGILVSGLSYILYGLYVEKPKDSWRMV
jgi:hypothetical protein